MKKVMIIVVSITVIFTLSTCKSSSSTDSISNNTDDFLSAVYAIKINKNKAGMAQAKTFTVKAKTLHKQKKYSEAELEWKNALKHYADAEMYYRFGDTLFNLSRFVDVVKAYKNAIELNHPEKKFVYYNLACAYSRMKNKDACLDYLRLAIKNGYKEINNVKNDKDLSFLRKQTNIHWFIRNLFKNSTTPEIGYTISEIFGAIEKRNPAILITLLKNGANPNGFKSLDNSPYNALMLASKFNDINAINILLDYGADPDDFVNAGAVGYIFVSVLYAAVQYNRFDIIKLLIKRKMNIKILGRTPLCLAITQGNLALVDLLLNNGVPINETNFSSCLPLVEAIKSQRREIIDLLLKKGANPNKAEPGCCGAAEITPLMAAVLSNDVRTTKLLFLQNVNINYVNWHKNSALIYAIQNANSVLAVELLNRGAKFNNVIINSFYGGGYNGYSLLMYAILFCPKIVPLLIKKGADIHYKKSDCDENCTALQIAKSKGLNDIVKLLIAAGARE